MKSISTLLLFACFFVACKKESTINTPQPDKASEQKTLQLTVNNRVRSYILYLPTGYNNAGKMPLIFVLHGGSGTATGMLSLADFRPIAERDKVILVYPDGIQNNWNDGRPTTPNTLGVDDVHFFSELSAYLMTNYPVDATKMYATGISNGGFMSSRLGCELSNKIAAIAVDAATMEQNTIYANCNPGKPVPAIYIHGTGDPLVSINGGQMNAGAGGIIISHSNAIAKWVSINGCNTTPTISNLPDISADGTTIQKTTYAGGTNGCEVVSYIITNGGHTWPKGAQYLSELIIGKTSQDMDACEVIWQFFKRFNR